MSDDRLTRDQARINEAAPPWWPGVAAPVTHQQPGPAADGPATVRTPETEEELFDALEGIDREEARVDDRGRLIVIGVTGKARTGKDTMAGYLTLARGCHRVALADGVRSAFDDLSGPTKELHKELGGENYNQTYRWALQTLGTEARNEVNAPGLWVHLLLAKVRFLSVHWPRVRQRFVIPDIRFRHEVSMIRHQTQMWGGSFGCLRLTYPGPPAIAEAAHVSETELETIRADREYENAGTVEDLAAAAVGFFDDVAAGRVSGNF